MRWAKVPFQTLYAIPSKNGVNKPTQVRGDGFKMVNMGELFQYGRIGDVPMERVPLTDREHEQNLLEEGDLLFARQSLVLEGAGKCSIVQSLAEPTTFEGHLIRVRLNRQEADPRFFYYYFGSPFSPVRTIVQQCAQAGIKASDLAKLDVHRPEIPTQHRIAAILSAYDDLIDNNERRIQLLEQAARLLYQEWFVRLRFPGYEQTRIVNGVPEGWEKATASDVMNIMSGGTPKTGVADYWEGEIPFYASKDAVSSPYVLKTERSITDRGLQSCNTRLYPKDTVFISARGTVGKVNLAQRPMAMSQSCYALVGKHNVSQFFLYCAMKAAANHLKQHAVGAIFDAIVVNTFRLIPFLVPTESVARQFTDAVSPVFHLIENLLLQNITLQKARDLLLPKLMSGEIEV